MERRDVRQDVYLSARELLEMTYEEVFARFGLDVPEVRKAKRRAKLDNRETQVSLNRWGGMQCR